MGRELAIARPFCSILANEWLICYKYLSDRFSHKRSSYGLWMSLMALDDRRYITLFDVQIHIRTLENTVGAEINPNLEIIIANAKIFEFYSESESAKWTHPGRSKMYYQSQYLKFTVRPREQLSCLQKGYGCENRRNQRECSVSQSSNATNKIFVGCCYVQSSW
jgi:hypothetical protein